MKEKKVFIKAFGLNEFGLVDFSGKISNIKISRLEFGNLRGCSWCFPHGFETSNSTLSKNRKSWKFKRKKQYKTSNSLTLQFIKNNRIFNLVDLIESN